MRLFGSRTSGESGKGMVMVSVIANGQRVCVVIIVTVIVARLASGYD